jgi:pimeloyl-ACP methyl ester carboxylesterase
MQQRTVHRLHVSEDAGPSPLIVFVHGTLDRASSFSRVRRSLRGQFATIAYDRRGYHHSIAAGAAPLVQHADDLATIIDGRVCVLVGHSFGGLVSAGTVADRDYLSFLASRVVGMLCYEPPAPWHVAWPNGSPAARALLHRNDPEEAVVEFFSGMVGDNAWQRLGDATRAQRIAEAPAMLADLDSAHPHGISSDQSPVEFAQIGIPTLCVHGDQSPAHLVASTNYIADQIRGSRRSILIGSAHGPHLSDPVGFAGLVADFARSVA